METLGVIFDDKVNREGFSSELFSFIHKLFDWLLNDDVKSSLAKMTGESVDTIPNPYEEWSKGVIKKLFKTPIGEKLVAFLSELVKRGQFKVERRGYSPSASWSNWKPFLDEIKERLQIDPLEMKRILKIAVGSESEFVAVSYETNYQYSPYPHKSSEKRYILHSEYHLDLILKIESERSVHNHTWYDCDYVVRKTRAEVLQKILNEVVK